MYLGKVEGSATDRILPLTVLHCFHCTVLLPRYGYGMSRELDIAAGPAGAGQVQVVYHI